MFLTYGRDASDTLIHISDAPSGNACNLVCPFCAMPLTARKGDIMGHHFAHQHDSCRSVWASTDTFIPSYEGYYLMGLSKHQQRATHEIAQQYGWHSFYADEINQMRLQSLIAQNMLALVRYQPDERERMRDVAQLTDKAKAFLCQFSLTEFTQFMRAEIERSRQRLAAETDPEYQVALAMLENEIHRLNHTTLYFLRIETTQGCLHKIGITIRPIEQRLSEIRDDLQRQQREVIQITPLYQLIGVAYIEGYFKAKYAAQQVEMGAATEYFTLDDMVAIISELDELQQAVNAGFPEAVRVEHSGDRPRFRATFERYHRRENPFAPRGRDHVVMLVDITTLATGECVADWQYFIRGKGFDALGTLQKGDVLEFTGVVEQGKVKRPAKLVKLPPPASYSVG